MVLAAACAVLVTAQIKTVSFYAHGPYDSSVPRPESMLGYELGQQHTVFRDQERVVLAIASAAKAKVRTFEYGKSTQGRPLRVFAISSPANISRLEQIRADNLKLASGTAGADTERLIRSTPAIVWINQTIHGDETASFESAMALMYNLAASRNEKITKTLDNAVVILNPVYNPDGHERYVVFYNSVPNGSPERGVFETSAPSTMLGRTNHYRFDMNRDRIAFSQAETRGEVAEFLRWYPHVYVDQHGQTSNYFFPPNPMSVNANTDRARINKWTEVFGRATAKEFDTNGWTYFVKDSFDLYYPGYLDSSASLWGAIGMTHETDGGRTLRRRREDESILTMRDGAIKHHTSALAVIGSAAANRQGLVDSFAVFKRRAAAGEFSPKIKRVVMHSDDPRELKALKSKLEMAGVRSYYSGGAWKQGDATDYWSGTRGEVTFPTGSLIVEMAQPNGPMAKALLEPGSDFEAEFIKEQKAKKKTAPEGERYPGPEGHEFYDMTGWSIPYAHNVRAWWCESAPAVAAGELAIRSEAVNYREPQAGFALRYTAMEHALAAADAIRSGVRGVVTTKPMRLGGKQYAAGTFMFLSARNDEGFGEKLEAIARRHGVSFEAVSTSYPDEGREGPGLSAQVVKKPNIAVVFGDRGNIADVGAMWYLMENVFNLPYTPLAASALAGDIDDYTCIVVPAGAGVSLTPKLREWVSAGGSLVVLDNPSFAIGEGAAVKLDRVEGEIESLPGSLFRAQMDARSFLSYGYGAGKDGWIEIAVPVSGDTFYKVRKEGGSVVRFSDDEKATKLLSGWSWDETEKTLRGTTWLQDAPMGGGHVILFTQNPTERAMWPGLYKMLLNAMLLGAG